MIHDDDSSLLIYLFFVDLYIYIPHNLNYNRPQTRRPGGTLFINFAMATIIGVVSGNYIFKDAIREHFEGLAETEEGRQQLRSDVITKKMP